MFQIILVIAASQGAAPHRFSDLVFTPDVFTKIYAGLATAVIIGVFKLALSRLRSRRLLRTFKDDQYTSAAIKLRAADNHVTYVRQDCQDNNPAGPSPDVNRRKIFEEIDRLLGPPLAARFTLVLGDTGMGKSTFLEKYYEYHWRSPRRSKRFKLVVMPLAGIQVSDLLSQIGPEACGETVLFLDALDEDQAAKEDFANRLSDLVKLAGTFRAVLITCRTQFLANSACIPEEIELPEPSGPMPLSAVPDQKVRKLFLSPLSGDQVRGYLDASFPFWRHPILRARAGRTAKRFGDLMSRPLLLTFIQDLASSPDEPKYLFQVYRLIVDAWLAREKRKHLLTIEVKDLIRFSTDFAINLFATGRDRVPFAELQSMARRFRVLPVLREVQSVPRDVHERSLLHNDGAGNWKFAHGSIMEYLLARAASEAEDRPPWLDRPWTPQMRLFVGEMLVSGECRSLAGADLRGLELAGTDLSGRDLSGTNLGGVDLSDCRLSAADLSNANLSDACMVNTKLDQASLRGACLDRARLIGVDLSRARGLTLQQATAATIDQATVLPVRAILGHSKAVAAVAIAPNGWQAVSASWDRTLKVWDAETGEELGTLRGHSEHVCGVAITSDGEFAVSASADRTLRVWDLATRIGLRVLIGHSDSVLSLALTGDGERLVSASADMTLKVWNVETGVELRELVGHLGSVNAVAVTPDGQLAISASSDSTLKVWDIESGIELRTLAGHLGSANAVAVSPDGKRVVSGASDKTLRVWDLETGRQIYALAGHAGRVNAVAVTPDGKCFVSASGDRTIKLWDLETGGELFTLAGHTNSVEGVAISADGRLALSASSDRALRVWPTPEISRELHVRVAERNAQLMAQQASLRRRVRTPEFHFAKHFDNSQLPTVIEPGVAREMRLFSAAVAVLFALIIIYGLQRFYVIEGGYRVESEKQLLDKLREENLELRLELRIRERSQLGIRQTTSDPVLASSPSRRETHQNPSSPAKP